MPTVFGVGQGKPVLEIKPTSPFVVLYGNKSEAPAAELTGSLVLTHSDSMQVKGIKMKLTGMRKVSWMTNTVTPQPIVSKTPFFRRELVLYPTDGAKNNKPHKISGGTHEWPFKFEIPGNIDESVEGLMGTYIVFNLSATVDRGYMSKDLVATKHIRIIRTLGQDTMDTVPLEQINEDIWASKIAYKITVPQKDYIIGTSIPAEFILVPLRKGVEIGTIKMEVSEYMVLHSEMAGRQISHSRDTVVAWKEFQMPENAARLVPEGVEDAPQLSDESYSFKLSLDLPRSLKICRQSVDTDNLKIAHKLKLYVNLHNPEGHTSQLLVKNHLNLFISPHLPPGEDQSVTVDQDLLASATTALRGDPANINAPPTYGAHQLDELYQDIDTHGYGFTTPTQRSGTNTGVNTPFYALSRNPSHENLHSMDGIAQDGSAGASASALHSRLSNLSVSQNRNSVHFSPRNSYHSSGVSTPYAPPESISAPVTRHGSGDGYFPDVDSLGNRDYDMETLSRIPSYNTAVKTPATETPLAPPTYDIATSRPASPVNYSPPQRSGASTPSASGSLATLREETERNTQLNSGHASRRNSQDGSR